MTTNAVRNRAAAGAFALIGALSLAACGPDDAPVATGSTQSSTTGGPSSSSSSESSSESSTTSSESSTSTETPTSSESSTASSTEAAGPTEPSAKNATFSFGEPAVIQDSDETYRLTVKDLQVAPDSVYSDGKLDKAKGTVYFVNFEVSPIKFGSTGKFRTSSINGLFLHPSFEKSQTARRMYGSVDACKTDSSSTLQIGESGKGCYIYQITGDKSTKVVYNDYKYNITWS